LISYNSQNIYTDRLQLRPSVDQVYRCRRSYEASTITQVVAANFGAVTPAISSVNDIASLQGVFDQYRIMKIQVVFRPSLVPNGIPAGEFYTALDFDDGVALTTIGQALDYSSVVITPVQVQNRRCFIPRAAPAFWASAAFAGYGTAPSPWLNTASTAIQHYGVKYAIDAYAVAANAVTIVPYVTLELEFRASR